MMNKAWLRAAAAAAFLLFPTGASAEEFTLFIYETPADIALRSDQRAQGAAYWRQYADFGAALAREGALRSGAPLVADAAAPSFAGLVLGGYFSVEAPSLEAAQRYAAMAPTTRRGGQAIVAQHIPSGAMMAR